MSHTTRVHCSSDVADDCFGNTHPPRRGSLCRRRRRRLMTTTRTKTPLVGWAILVPSSNRTPSVTRSVLVRRPLPTAFPGRSGRGSSRTPHRCRRRQVFAGRVMPVNPRAVVYSLTRPRTMRAVVSFSPIQHRDHRCSKM